MVETACSTGAGLAARPSGRSVVGVENHTSFIRAVREGALLSAVALPVTRGRRSQVWEVTIRDERLRPGLGVRLEAHERPAAGRGEALGVLLALGMMMVPIKMYLRWTINLKYFVAIPELFFNI